jgi:hypothetical protein
LRLDDAGVLVSVHGRIDMTAEGAGIHDIPAKEPLQVRIPWCSGDDPTAGLLAPLIQAAVEGKGQ